MSAKSASQTSNFTTPNGRDLVVPAEVDQYAKIFEVVRAWVVEDGSIISITKPGGLKHAGFCGVILANIARQTALAIHYETGEPMDSIDAKIMSYFTRAMSLPFTNTDLAAGDHSIQ